MPLSLPSAGGGYPSPMVLSTMTRDVAAVGTISGSSSGASVAWGTAAKAVFWPVRLAEPRTYVTAWWVNGATVAGNVDVGIYTISGTTATRIVASTAEAAAGAGSTVQVATTFTSTTLQPGTYWLAMSCSLATATTQVANSGPAGQQRAMTAFQSTTSHPLPSTVTVVAYAVTNVPVYGFSELVTM